MGRELEGIKTRQLVHLGETALLGPKRSHRQFALVFFVCLFCFVFKYSLLFKQAEKSQTGKGLCWRGDRAGEWFKGLWPQPHLSSGHSFLLALEWGQGREHQRDAKLCLCYL